MKTKQFAELLEIIVRKVVREELKPILNEVRRNSKPIIKERATKEFDPLDVSHILETTKPKKQTPKMKFSENSLLGQMLNETADSGEWRTMDSTFGANQAQGFNRQAMASSMGYGEHSMIPDTDVDGKPVNMEALQSSGVANALTKDYSALMKTINAKKGR